MTRLLFVYDSLRPGQDNDMARLLAAHAKALGGAQVAGRLVQLNGHPALRPGGAARIDGELWLLKDLEVLSRLDLYEGVGEPGWYERELVVAIDGDGAARSAWAYVSPPERAPSPRA